MAQLHEQIEIAILKLEIARLAAESAKLQQEFADRAAEMRLIEESVLRFDQDMARR